MYNSKIMNGAMVLEPQEVMHFSLAFAKNAQSFIQHLPSFLVSGTGKRKQKVAHALTQLLEDLGPTFVKFGQIASTRADLFPEYLTNALERLQDSVKPFPPEQARETIEKELGKKFNRHFASFEKHAAASGSLAQVHRARLKTGEDVAVKILRPGIEQRVQTDLTLFHGIAAALERTLMRKSMIKPTHIIEEVGNGLKKHCDFTHEVKNLKLFTENFNGDKRILFANPYPHLSTRKVMTMDFIDGVKLTQFHKVNGDPEVLARIGMDAVFKMVFVDGFVHGDMHPANIFVLSGNRVAFLDVGMSAKLTPSMKKNTMNLLLGIVKKDKKMIAKYLFIMGEGKKHFTDYKPFEKTVYDTLSGYFDKPLGELKMANLLREFFQLLYRFRLTLSPSYALLLTSLVSLEGAAKKLFPDANIFTYAGDFLKIMGVAAAI